MTELDRLCRAEWGHLLSALIRAIGDFDVAEEALQDAFAVAVTDWAATGVPRNARAWLYGTARHKAIDRLRRRARFAHTQAELLVLADPEAGSTTDDADDEEIAVPDERLRLIFTCCHPALAPDAQVALTLRTLCGLTTEEIARAFLVPVPTMAQRLVRAKGKIRGAAIPYAVPAASELPERLEAVMSVLYLVFNEGYAATLGEAWVRRELCADAIDLARVLRSLLSVVPPEVDALLALMLLHDARRDARVDADGELVLLADQDRARWDHAQIAEGVTLVQSALCRAPPGPYALEAAIAAVHAEAHRATDTDWAQIVGLYERLSRVHPSPVVVLNRAVAIAMARGAAAALPLVDALAQPLDGYHLWHATRADLLRRLDHPAEALVHYRRAHALAQNEPERRFLARRIAALESGERQA